MDLEKTGMFIAQLRKARGLSQEQLGGIIGVTNKTISRWETGTYLPPAEMLLALSELFDVSINELLSGRKLSGEEYKSAAEGNLAAAIKSSRFTLKEKIGFYKKKWLKEHLFSICCWGVGVAAVFMAGIISKRPWLFSAAVLLFLAGHIWRNNTMMAYVERKAFDGAEDNG